MANFTVQVRDLPLQQVCSIYYKMLRIIKHITILCIFVILIIWGYELDANPLWYFLIIAGVIAYIRKIILKIE